MNLGETIKTLRKERGMKQKDLAEKAGISANALLFIEKDRSLPTRETIDSICKALDISVSYLLLSALTDDDVPKEKRELFKILREPLMSFVEEKEKTPVKRKPYK